MLLQHLIHFSQNQQEMVAIFIRLNLMSRLVLQFHRTIHFLMCEQVSSQWHGMVMCILNNALLLNFLLPEKESVPNTHKQLKFV
jgi:hypothetical protein